MCLILLSSAEDCKVPVNVDMVEIFNIWNDCVIKHRISFEYEWILNPLLLFIDETIYFHAVTPKIQYYSKHEEIKSVI